MICKPELTACPHCGGPLILCDYLAWDKTVQTLDAVLSVASRPACCTDSSCPGRQMRLLAAAGQQIAPCGFTYGYDVLARIGWLRPKQRGELRPKQRGELRPEQRGELRPERRDTYGEIQAGLARQIQISVSHVAYLYRQVYLPSLACCERQYKTRLAQSAQQHGGLIISLDGLAPEGGEPQLWFIRELLTGLTLRSGWSSRFNQVILSTWMT